MKFSDVKKFYNLGNYRVDVSWRSLVDQLERWKEEDNFDMVPDFQRGHVWSTEQQRSYVEYKLQGGHGADNILWNHEAWMTFDNPDATLVLVDGLQRLTAVLAFLNNELSVFGGAYYKDFEDKLNYDVKFVFFVNNLLSRKHVLEWYIQINTGGTVHTKEEIDRVHKLLEKEAI